VDLTFAATGEISGNRLSGVAHVFGTKATIAGVSHIFSEDAFDLGRNVYAFYHHDASRPLASTDTGSLVLAVKGGKLHYSMELGDQSYAQDLRANVAQGLMGHMSFGVNPRKWEMTKDGARLHTAADLFEVSPVTMPAFDKTSAQLHSAPAEWSRSQAVRARARVAEMYR
jgi:HK97 family phage prohead protease